MLREFWISRGYRSLAMQFKLSGANVSDSTRGILGGGDDLA